MTDRTLSTRDLFVKVNGHYSSFSELEDKLVATYGEHAAEMPTLFGINRLLEIGRERGWIKSSEHSVDVETA